MVQGLGTLYASHLCDSFAMSSRFTVGWEFDSVLTTFMFRTYLTEHDDGRGVDVTQRAHFGSLLTTVGGAYVAGGHLTRIPFKDTIEVALSFTVDVAAASQRRPPRIIKPVFDLLKGAPVLFGKRPFSCTVEFAYDDDQGVRSAFPLPMGLVLPQGAGGITHIENATFSRRTDQGLVYSVFVMPPEGTDPLKHFVEFEEEFTLSRGAVGQVLRRARGMSSQLLEHVQQEEASGG